MERELKVEMEVGPIIGKRRPDEDIRDLEIKANINNKLAIKEPENV